MPAIENRLRRLLRRDTPGLGTWITLGDPALTEVAGLAGFDFVAVDLEHTAIGLESLAGHLRAAAARSIATLVRAPSPEPKQLLAILDLGVEGILIPGVTDAAGARAAVGACRYPPLGDRGVSGASRAAAYGAHGLGGARQLADHQNRELVVGLMVEDAAAVADADAIAGAEGLDLLFMGPADLSASLGKLGSAADAEIAAAVARVAGIARDRGRAFGMPVGHPAYPLTLGELTRLGSRLVTSGTDVTTLLAGFRQSLEQLRS